MSKKSVNFRDIQPIREIPLPVFPYSMERLPLQIPFLPMPNNYSIGGLPSQTYPLRKVTSTVNNPQSYGVYHGSSPHVKKSDS